MKRAVKPILTTLFLSALLFIIILNMFLANIPEAMITGKAFLKLDKSQFKGEIVDAELYLQDITWDGSRLSMVGEVKYNGESKSLKINGRLLKSGLFEKGVTGDFKDEENSFQFIYFNIADLDQETAKQVLLHMDHVDEGRILRLYLFQESGRELSFFEAKIDDIEGYQDILNQILEYSENLEEASPYKDHWFTQIFEPIQP